MLSLVKGFLKEEDGMGTVEVVLILAVLVTIALIFRKTIQNWVETTLGEIFDAPQDVNDINDGLKQN